MEKCAQSMLLVAVCSARGSHLETWKSFFTSSLLDTRGSCVCATLGGETPPAQDGTQILGTGDVSSSCRFTVDGASLQFIDRVVVFAVMLQRQVRTRFRSCTATEAATAPLMAET